MSKDVHVWWSRHVGIASLSAGLNGVAVRRTLADGLRFVCGLPANK